MPPIPAGAFLVPLRIDEAEKPYLALSIEVRAEQTNLGEEVLSMVILGHFG